MRILIGLTILVVLLFTVRFGIAYNYAGSQSIADKLAEAAPAWTSQSTKGRTYRADGTTLHVDGPISTSTICLHKWNDYLVAHGVVVVGTNRSIAGTDCALPRLISEIKTTQFALLLVVAVVFSAVFAIQLPMTQAVLSGSLTGWLTTAGWANWTNFRSMALDDRLYGVLIGHEFLPFLFPAFVTCLALLVLSKAIFGQQETASA